MSKTIYFGVGCFWGAQKYYDQIKGIEKTSVGYLNGPSNNATYEEVCAGSGHVEVVKIIYNRQINYEELFFSFIRVVDPFSLNKQSNDQGVQYRIGIYYTLEDQKNQFILLLKKWEQNNKKTVIEIELANNFVLAENYHQKYLDKNPGGYCHIKLNEIPNNLQKKIKLKF